MIVEEKKGLKLLRFENLAGAAGLTALVSTRTGGLSPEPCSGLNLGFGGGDAAEIVSANLRLLCEAAGVPFERTLRMRQSHTANVKVIDGGSDWASPVENADALITDLKNTPLLALSADCALTVFYDPAHSALAVCHCGWRGALLNIYAQVLAALRLRYGTAPGNLIAGVSPMISAENYPIKEDFVEKLRAFYPEEISRRWMVFKYGRRHFSLKELLKYQLHALGVTDYEFAHMCTYADKELFYSRRRDGENAGRFGLLAMLT